VVCSVELVAPFGDSKDGVNAGAWGLASRQVRHAGLGPSRWGAQASGRAPEVYVNHPPLIVATTAASEAALGEHPWSSRLPNLLATGAAGVLVLLITLELGHRPATALAATALAFGAPMVRTYGAMVDTPVLGLPFAAGLTLLWVRSRHGRPAPPLAWAAVGVTTMLASWLGWAIAPVVLVSLVIRRERRAAIALGSGILLGGAAVLVWVVQSGAGVDGLLGLAATRSGARAAVSLPDGLRANLASAYPAWTLVLALPGLVLAFRREASRGVAGLWWVTVVAWCVAFQERAATHEYWTWWALLPLAVGWAALLDATVPHLTSRAVRRSLPAVAVALGMVGAVLPSPGWTRFEGGVEAGRLLSATTYPPGQARAWVLSDGSDVLPWVSYETGIPMTPLRPADLDGLAASAPSDLVLAAFTRGRASATVASERCLAAPATRGGYVLATASDLRRGVRPGCQG